MSPTQAKPKRSKTASEAALDQRDATQDTTAGLEDAAKAERKSQAEQLSAGKSGPKGARLKTVAESRSRRPGETPLNGVVDNMTQRDGTDALEGHFVVIDYSDKKTKEMVESQLAPEGSPLADQGFEAGLSSADYGVYMGAGEIGEDGYPVTGRVFLRDEHAAIINVPYDSLRRATAGGRR
jgi:hypothetical protein